MKRTGNIRFNALDVVIVLLVAAAVAAFCLRGRVSRFFAEEGSHVITYTFAVIDVEDVTAASLKAGVSLFSTSGVSVGEVLTCGSSAASDEQLLPDGRTVEVLNGLTDLTGSVTATGYSSDGFVYLDGGILLVPGGTLVVSTGDALFTFRITAVSVSEEDRAK